MTTDRRVGKQAPDQFRREETATRLDTGPYIGKVMNNIDPTRSGRLQVYIPDLSSGDETSQGNWRTVAYASPFFGSTTQPDSNKQNAFSKVRHTYGFWAVPPDIGNFVLCTFVAGDPARGFWFACIPNQLGHMMVPGIAGTYKVDDATIEDANVAAAYDFGPTVTSEFNENTGDLDWYKFALLKKPIHEEIFKVLLEQGLETDYIRGIISSSSQRETPSTVFGMSTPGRPLNDPAGSSTQESKIASGDIAPGEYKIGARKGGHTFVMDDGNWQGKDQLIRLRTAGGHQLLMNDSEHILYIGNSDGSVWVEMTGPGHLNIFAAASVNVRAQGDLNFHADNDINFHAGGSFNVHAANSLNLQSTKIAVNSAQELTLFGGKVGVGSSGAMDLNASGPASYTSSGDNLRFTGKLVTLNEGSGPAVRRPMAIKMNALSDTGKDGLVWKSVDGALDTIVPIAPTHEPWSYHLSTKLAGSVSVTAKPPVALPEGGTSGNTATASDGVTTRSLRSNNVTSGAAPAKDLPVVECKGGKPVGAGPEAAQNQGVKNPVNQSYLNRNDNPAPPGPVGPLTQTQTKALMTQLGWNESSFNYGVANQYNYLGKYQVGAPVLADQGYIKRDAVQLYGNKAVNYPNSWTGKDGITSRESFLSSTDTQEKVMYALLNSNYKTLTRIGALQSGDDLCAVAGMLAASHLIGAGGAKNWRDTGGGSDANGTTGTQYYNMGRYAVDVLAANNTNNQQA